MQLLLGTECGADRGEGEVECNRISRSFDYSKNSIINIRLADDRELEKVGRSWEMQ